MNVCFICDICANLFCFFFSYRNYICLCNKTSLYKCLFQIEFWIDLCHVLLIDKHISVSNIYQHVILNWYINISPAESLSWLRWVHWSVTGNFHWFVVVFEHRETPSQLINKTGWHNVQSNNFIIFWKKSIFIGKCKSKNSVCRTSF